MATRVLLIAIACALAPLLTISAQVSSDQRYVLIKGGNREKVERLVNEHAALGYRWMAADIFPGTGNAWTVVRHEEGARNAYRLLEQGVLSRLFRELDEAGSQGFRLIPRARQPFGPFPMLVLERPPDSSPVKYVGMEVDSDNEKATRAINDARRKGAVITLVTGRYPQTKPIVVMEAGQPPATEYRAYRVVETTRLSTFEKEVARAGVDGFRYLCCALQNALFESTIGQEPRREYRLVSAWRGTKFDEEVAALGSQGFRVVGAPGTGDEWTFIMERVPGVSKRYAYLRLNLRTEEQLDRVLTNAESKGFQVIMLVTDRAILERISEAN